MRLACACTLVWTYGSACALTFLFAPATLKRVYSAALVLIQCTDLCLNAIRTRHSRNIPHRATGPVLVPTARPAILVAIVETFAS